MRGTSMMRGPSMRGSGSMMTPPVRLLGQWVVLELSWRTVTWCDVAELRWGGTKERLQQRFDWRGHFVKRAQQQMVPLEKACKSNHASCEESRVVRKE